jgi:transposase
VHEAADAEAQQTPEQRIASLEAQLADATRTITRLRDQYTRALEKLVLMQRRLVVTSAERRFETSTDQLELELRVTEVAALKKELDAAEKAAGAAPTDEAPSKPSATSPSAKKTDGRKKRATAPTGRRGAELAELPKIYAPVIDPELEGKAERIGFVESYKLGHERGGPRCIVVQIAVYKKPASAEVTPQATSPSPHTDTNASAGCRIVRARRPLEMIRRGMLAPSMIAYLLVQKYLMGLPFHRLEQQFARQGFSLDRGTMARYSEEIGSMLGFVVDAAREQAIATAFCLSTDATGVSIQPTPLDDGRHQPCRKGHFFVTLADRDHVFFDYQAKHDSLAVWHMFKGYKGYIQADAHVIYDAVFRGTPPDGAEETEAEAAKRAPPPLEVGCWSHARRHMWEAAVCRYPLGLEGLRRITALFDADRPLQDLPPVKRKAQRDKLLRPLVDDFFTWAKAERAKINSRSRIASALGYVLNQEGALRRFLDDGRLRLENNGAERALRTIAVGRKAWLFFGSDDHATAAGNLFSLIASCKLHGLDPETYLADVIRVFPYWPAARRLELAPKFWAKTRARLDARELELPVGHISVPPPAAEQQGASG